MILIKQNFDSISAMQAEPFPALPTIVMMYWYVPWSIDKTL